MSALKRVATTLGAVMPTLEPTLRSRGPNPGMDCGTWTPKTRRHAGVLVRELLPGPEAAAPRSETAARVLPGRLP